MVTRAWLAHLGSHSTLNKLQQYIQPLPPQLQVGVAAIRVLTPIVIERHRDGSSSNVDLSQRQTL